MRAKSKFVFIKRQNSSDKIKIFLETESLNYVEREKNDSPGLVR